MVSFTPGNSNNDVVTHFTVYVRSSNDAINKEEGPYNVALVVPGPGPHNAVVGLEPWRDYSFYVVAQNSVGTSLPSEVPSRVCSTPPVAPSANPAIVCAEQRSSDALVIQWEVSIATRDNSYIFGFSNYSGWSAR
jgi:Fibronectin type III domain